MRPLVLPASTVNTGGAAVASQALADITIWLFQNAGWTVPEGIQLAISIVFTTVATMAACHFTTDTPSPTVAKEAVADAAADADMDAAEDRAATKKRNKR